MSQTTDIGVAMGEPVYDADGARLGTVRGIDEHGFYVTVEDGVAALSSEHVAAGEAAEAELMWRCWACGAMGEISDIPDGCPDCGAPKEDIYYWTED